jgi:hypothetical protein
VLLSEKVGELAGVTTATARDPMADRMRQELMASMSKAPRPT